MADPAGALLGAVVAAGVSAALAAAGARASRGDAALEGLAVVMAWVWGTVAGAWILRALPHVPPLSGLDRLLLVLLPVAVAIETEVAAGWLDGVWLAVERAVVSLVAIPVLLHGSVWMEGGGAWPAVLAASLFLFAAWQGIAGQVAATGDRLVAATTVAALLVAGIAIGAGGWVTGAMSTLPPAAALAGAMLAARSWRGRAAVSSLGIVSLFGTAVVGTCFGRLSFAAAVLVVVAPLLASVPDGIAWFLPESAGERVLRSRRYRLLLAAVPLLAVLVRAGADADALLRRLAEPAPRHAPDSSAPDGWLAAPAGEAEDEALPALGPRHEWFRRAERGEAGRHRGDVVGPHAGEDERAGGSRPLHESRGVRHEHRRNDVREDHVVAARGHVFERPGDPDPLLDAVEPRVVDDRRMDALVDVHRIGLRAPQRRRDRQDSRAGSEVEDAG